MGISAPPTASLSQAFDHAVLLPEVEALSLPFLHPLNIRLSSKYIFLSIETVFLLQFY